MTRLTLQRPLPLQMGDAGPDQGMLAITAARVQIDHPGAEFLRRDLINIADVDVGILAYRHTAQAQRRLTQQALIQATEQLYYVLTFTTPTGKARADEQLQENGDSDDPQERLAVETFRRVLDSVRLLDRTDIREDQDQRLFRTRAWFVNLKPARIKAALVGEQWLRLIHDGKDIGYTYIIEEIDTIVESSPRREPLEAVYVGVRSRTVPEPDVQVETASRLYCSLDRTHENWSSVAVITPKEGEKDHFSEFGASARLISRVHEPLLDRRDARDPGQPGVRQEEVYTLNVTRVGKRGGGEPLTRELPPFYLPQAINHLLPRLLPLDDPKTYLFATYVSEEGEVMLRYVDVEHEQTVTLAGQSVRAVPIHDRIGLEGSVTLHYLSPEGRYLGSVNEDLSLTILPTDAATLQRIWPDVDLSRPAEVERR